MVPRLLLVAFIAWAAPARATESPPGLIFGTIGMTIAMASICKIELGEPGASRSELVGLGDRIGRRFGMKGSIETLAASLIPIMGKVDECAQMTEEIKAGAHSIAAEARQRLARD